MCDRLFEDVERQIRLHGRFRHSMLVARGVAGLFLFINFINAAKIFASYQPRPSALVRSLGFALCNHTSRFCIAPSASTLA